MILNNHPDAPRTSYGNVKFIGYWTSPYYLERNREDLPNPKDFVDDSWDKKEKDIVINYLNTGQDIEYWKGFSYCRFGCGSLRGSTDKSDGKWVWPAAFYHYVDKHNVKPPIEFLKDVIKDFKS